METSPSSQIQFSTEKEMETDIEKPTQVVSGGLSPVHLKAKVSFFSVCSTKCFFFLNFNLLFISSVLWTI